MLGTPSSKAAPFSLPDVPVSVYGTTLVARGYYFGLCATFSFQSLLCNPLAIIQDFIFFFLMYCYFSNAILFYFLKFVIYLWLCWVFVSVRGLSLVATSGGHSSSRCAGLSLSRPLLLRSTGSRCASSVIVAHGPSCSVACGIFPDQGSNPCPLHWQADSQPLHHQGSPETSFLLISSRKPSYFPISL